MTKNTETPIGEKDRELVDRAMELSAQGWSDRRVLAWIGWQAFWRGFMKGPEGAWMWAAVAGAMLMLAVWRIVEAIR